MVVVSLSGVCIDNHGFEKDDSGDGKLGLQNGSVL